MRIKVAEQELFSEILSQLVYYNLADNEDLNVSLRFQFQRFHAYEIKGANKD